MDGEGRGEGTGALLRDGGEEAEILDFFVEILVGGAGGVVWGGGGGAGGRCGDGVSIGVGVGVGVGHGGDGVWAGLSASYLSINL